MTITANPAETLAPWERELDGAIDDTLLDLARTERVRRVGGSKSSHLAIQSGESRAWTKTGNVD